MLTNFEMMARIALMRYALVKTNDAPIPPEIVKRWLDYITGQRNDEPCVLCGDRQLEDCHWACLGEVSNES
jgi:hypothetical protein